MKKECLLTVNVITYNHEEWIGKCLDSVLEQKTDFDYIVRIFDDCSTDGTKEICREYEKKYPEKILFFPAEKNLGLINGVLVNALRAYEDIKTPYFLFIEGDDFRLNENGFQRQIDELEKHQECSFCASKTVSFYQDKIQNAPFPHLKAGIYSAQDIIAFPSVIYYTSLTSRISRTKYLNIKSGEEYFALVDISQIYYLAQQAPFCIVDDVYAAYRISGKGESTKKNILDKCCSESEAVRKISNYFDDKFFKNLAFFFLADIRDIYSRLSSPPQSFETQRAAVFKNLFRNTAKFILPGGVIWAAHYIRDVLRLLRGTRK
ncbi:MAG: glycosyltransferase [Alphaproteobacteria bacterium]|nr:glycosyltransferase [Alphaproteobacteria bacterium]